MDDADFDKEVARVRRQRSRADIQNIIGLVMDSPLADAPVFQVDGEASLKDLATKNTDVKARIILQMAVDAAKGDLKAAEFLFKYGGYTPPTETEVTLDVPRIIDDIGTDNAIGQGDDALLEGEDDDTIDVPPDIVIYDDGRN